MIEFLTGAITVLIGVTIGYSLGKGSSIIPEETRKQVKKLIRALPIKNDLGAIPRPTAEQIRKYDNPIVQAEEEEMSNTFKEIVKP